MAIEQKIIGVESGGRRYAKNPRSSAYGPGQFISSTWLNMINTHRPDLAQGRSRDEILALRTDPGISAEMTRAYGQQNAQALQARGFAPTEGNTYLAHFAGPAGAVNLLSNPDKPVSQVLTADAIAANPFLKGWSARDVINWASRKMGGQSGAAPAAAAAPAAPPPKLEEKTMIPALFALASGAAPMAAASALPALGTAAAAPAATGGLMAGVLNSPSLAGGLANAAGFPETGGMLDNFFGGGQQSGQQANPAGTAPAAPDVGASPFVHASQSPQIDMSKIAAILQRRGALGI